MEPKKTINPLTLNLSELTLGEIDEIEELSGMAIDELAAVAQPGEGERPRPKAKLLRAMAYVKMKREDPSFTYEDTADLVLEVADGAVPPTGASG